MADNQAYGITLKATAEGLEVFDAAGNKLGVLNEQTAKAVTQSDRLRDSLRMLSSTSVKDVQREGSLLAETFQKLSTEFGSDERAASLLGDEIAKLSAKASGLGVEMDQSFRGIEHFGEEADDATQKSAQFGAATVALGVAIGNMVGDVLNKYIAALGKVIEFGAEAIDAYSAQEKATQSLSSALSSQGKLTEENLLSLQAMADGLMETAGIGDEVGERLAGLALNMGATATQAARIVPIAADMAVGLGISMDAAVRNVTKTLGGFAGELGEMIPAIKGLTEEQLKNGDALDIISKTYAGHAADALDTYGGKIEATKVKWNELNERLGGVLAEGFEPIIDAIGRSVTKLGEFGDEMDPVLIENFHLALKGLASGIDTITEKLSAGAEQLDRYMPIVNALSRIIFAMVPGFQNVADASRMATEKLVGMGKATEDAADGLAKGEQALDSFDRGVDDFNASVDAAAQMEAEWNAEQEAAAKLAAEATANIKTETVAVEEIARGVRTWAEAHRDLADAKRGSSSAGEGGGGGDRPPRGGEGRPALSPGTGLPEELTSDFSLNLDTGFDVEFDKSDPAIQKIFERLAKLQSGSFGSSVGAVSGALQGGDIGAAEMALDAMRKQLEMINRIPGASGGGELAMMVQVLSKLVSSFEAAAKAQTDATMAVADRPIEVNIDGRGVATAVVDTLSRGESGIGGGLSNPGGTRFG